MWNYDEVSQALTEQTDSSLGTRRILGKLDKLVSKDVSVTLALPIPFGRVAKIETEASIYQE